jgi:hypothetical protein
MKVEEINNFISSNKENPDFNDNLISDGWHTFGEMYKFRKQYNAALFNEWANYEYGDCHSGTTEKTPKYEVHKSWKHNDGEWCFGKEKKWFIVCANLPTGQISNHYKAEAWDLFDIPAFDKALYPFDGHTPQEVLTRLTTLNKIK